MQTAGFLEQTRLALLNAPFNEGGWNEAIGMVARATGSGAANLVAIGGPLLLPLNLFTGENSDRAQRYFADPHLWGTSNWRVGTTTEPMAIQHEAHYAAYRSQHKTADYDDAVSELDMALGCQCAMLMGEDHFLGLAMLRGRKDGPCDADTLETFRHLVKDAQRSVRMQIALADEQSAILLGDLSNSESRLILLDRLGQLVGLSPSAEPLFDEDGPFWLHGTGFALRDRQDDNQVRKAMGRLLKGSSESISGPYLHLTTIGRQSGIPSRAWHLSITKLPPAACALGFAAQLALTVKPVH